MTFSEMCEIEPGLARLEEHAHHAGAHGASWTSYLLASHERLTKLTGRGAHDERLQTAQAYEVARAALLSSWSRGSKSEPANDIEPATWPWEIGWGDGAEGFQHEMKAQYA